eukprot:6194600-Pleurochrysis_carterae.AAC.4
MSSLLRWMPRSRRVSCGEQSSRAEASGDAAAAVCSLPYGGFGDYWSICDPRQRSALTRT